MDTSEELKPPKYAAVVVHGICANNGSQQEGVSKPLSELVYPVKSQAERDKYWKEAVWEKVTNVADDKIHDIILQVMNLYDKTSCWREEKQAKATCWWHKICLNIGYVSSKVLHIVAADLAKDLLDLALDLPLYLGEPRGTKVRKVVTDKIEEAMEKTDGIILIGHSLGSVIAYDVVRDNIKTGRPLNIRTLITMGSPLKWVTDIRRAENGENGPPDLATLSLPGIDWINIYDREDPITLKNELPDTMFRDVKNIPIASGDTLIGAHTCYWTQDEVAAIVRKAMFATEEE